MKCDSIKATLAEFDRLDPKLRFWADEKRFRAENLERSPGFYISKFGYWVIGTTAGGNAITFSDHDEAVRFYDHTGWYDDSLTWAAKRDYTERPYTAENVKEAQIILATSRTELARLIFEGKLGSIIDRYD